MPTILLVDDDQALCGLFSAFLQQEGFDVDLCHSGGEAAARILSGSSSLVVLDIMLPGRSGLEILREVRASSTIPILMLTAKGDNVDRIVGLELGADDYLSKPFDPREALARIRAIMRRTLPRSSPGQEILAGEIRMSPSSRSAWLAGKPLDLTMAEFDILSVLAQAPGALVSKDELSRKGLGRSLLPFDRSIDMHVSNIRKKLDAAGQASDLIKTARGQGYMLALPARQGSGSQEDGA